MITVAISANWLSFMIRSHLGCNMMPVVALETHCVDFVTFKDDIRLRRPDIFVVRMIGAYPVAVDTTDLCLQVGLTQFFMDECHMAHIARCIGAQWITLVELC